MQPFRLLGIVVILLDLVALSWRTVISSFAGNVGLLLLARSLSSSVPLLLHRALGSADSAFDRVRRAVATDHGWGDPEVRFRAWHS